MRKIKNWKSGSLALLLAAALVITITLIQPVSVDSENAGQRSDYSEKSQSIAAPWLNQGYGVLIEVGSSINEQGKLVIDYAVFYPSDFQGPKGDTGPAGPEGLPGPAGPQGPTGAQGDTGPQGPAGLPGEQGDTGPQGLQGPMGPQGEAGPDGASGMVGPQGEAGPEGPQGPKGDQGPPGEQGDQGDQGPQGIQGPEGNRGNSPTAHYHMFQIGPGFKTSYMN